MIDVKPERHVVSVVDGEDTILLDLKRNLYYSLNEPAGRLWALLSDGMPTAAAVEQVSLEYDAAPAIVKADLTAVVQGLREAELVSPAVR